MGEERNDDLLAEQGHDYEQAEADRQAESDAEDAEVEAVEAADDGEADTVDDES
jgi:hypothetical protein